MRRNLKRFLALLLVFVTLTGCASGTKEASKENQKDKENKVETEKDPVKDPAEEKPLPGIVIDTTPEPEPEPEPEPMKPLDVNALATAGKDVISIGVDEAKAKQIDAILDTFPENISLAVWSTDGSKVVLYNTQQTYFSACTIKIPWILYLCKRIDEGKYSKDTVLTYQQKHYHDGSGIIRKGKYGDQYTVEKLIQLCLNISDNVAYEMLVDMIDRADFDAFVNELGYQSFKLRPNSMWSSNSVVKDYVGIWNEVYKYFQTGTDGAVMMKKGCTNSPFAYGVLTLKNADYSHKSGDNFGASRAYHDAGIVWAPTPYTYAIFSKCEGEASNIKKINEAMAIVHELFGGNVAQ